MSDKLIAKVDDILKNVNDSDREKYEIIKNIISTDDWYNKIDAEVTLSILIDLGYSMSEAQKEYMNLKGIK